uniref:Protein phosphatase 1, regulatory subunit 12B n=1 Tax=Poecilia formosa TaxID=48698 RepID=A0A096LRB9_POEFO
MSATEPVLVYPYSKHIYLLVIVRSYLAPVKDEEAESQRKAKSRHARQTRRSTQGVTLTDLKEAQMSYSLSHQDREKEEESTQGNRLCLRRGFADDTGDQAGLPESKETWIYFEDSSSPGRAEYEKDESSVGLPLDGAKSTFVFLHNFSRIFSSRSVYMQKFNLSVRKKWIGNSPTAEFVRSSQNLSGRLPQRAAKAEKSREKQGAGVRRGGGQANFLKVFNKTNKNYRKYLNKTISQTISQHERLSRYDSTGESATDKPMGRTSSYTRRETRLAALNKQEQDSTAKDYKKMYTEALQENERLKSRLHDSKQELVKIRSQLEKVAQRQDRMSERSTVLETEKREKQALEKRVTDMEEEIKAFPALAQVQALRRVNECLLAENRAMLRVLTRLSETASMPETEDL